MAERKPIEGHSGFDRHDYGYWAEAVVPDRYVEVAFDTCYPYQHERAARRAVERKAAEHGYAVEWRAEE